MAQVSIKMDQFYSKTDRIIANDKIRIRYIQCHKSELRCQKVCYFIHYPSTQRKVLLTPKYASIK